MQVTVVLQPNSELFKSSFSECMMILMILICLCNALLIDKRYICNEDYFNSKSICSSFYMSFILKGREISITFCVFVIDSVVI